MASKLKWMKAILRELNQDGRNFHSCSKGGGLTGSSQFIRSLKYNYGECSSRSKSGRGISEAAPADVAHRRLENGSQLKEAVSDLQDRVCRGIAVDSQDYVNVLKGCLKEKDFVSVKRVHDCIKKSQMEQQLYVANNLLKCYVGLGRLQTAQEIFNQLAKKDTITWTIMIGGLAGHNQAEGAIEMYKQMRNEGRQPNSVTYLSALKACASPTALTWGKDIHANIISDGLQANLRLCNALVHMYANCGSIEDARAVFNQILHEERDLISWNVMIGGLAQHGLGHEAFSLFLEMQREGFIPDSFTYVNILNPCSGDGALEWVNEVHAHAMKAGLDEDLRVGNALIHMYAKSGNIEDSRAVFDKMERRNIITWSGMIGGLAQHGLGHEAFSLFLQMQREGFSPNVITFLSIFNSRFSEGASEWVQEAHAYATKAGLDVDVRVGNALVHMYAKMGLIVNARQVFDKMLNRDVISWSSMIGGLAQHGHGREALQLFEIMKKEPLKPSRPLFVAVLSACSHAGLVDEGRLQFASMSQDHGIEPALEHYNCMVDILGRGGHLEEAKRFIFDMPIKPNIVTWTALLGACKIHKSVELAELVARECMKLEPTDATSYILLSNAYADVGDWDQVSLIRRKMHRRGIRKDPGRCWIEVENKVHHFVVGDTSHLERREIYAMLSSLSKTLKTEGYSLDNRFESGNIGEEDKESTISSHHSEMLALAYGLIHVPPGKPIRIYKNLRICIDCHTASKLISKVTGREIVARDANRFHHFKDGLCSCADYW